MALMVARFMRFYQYRYNDLLSMPVGVFFALYRKILMLQAEDDIRSVANHHTGEPKKRIDELAQTLKQPSSVVEKPPIVMMQQFPDVFQEPIDAGELRNELESLRERDRQRQIEWKQQQQEL